MALTPAELAAYQKLSSYILAVAPQRTETGRYAYQSSQILREASLLAEYYDQPLTFTEAQGVFGLISRARSNAVAADALNAAVPGQAIDASMIGQWYTAASLEVQAAQPQYFARAQISFTNAVGEQVTTWFQVKGITELPSSADALALRLTGLAIKAYTTPVSEGGKYEPAQMMTGEPENTQMPMYPD